MRKIKEKSNDKLPKIIEIENSKNYHKRKVKRSMKSHKDVSKLFVM